MGGQYDGPGSAVGSHQSEVRSRQQSVAPSAQSGSRGASQHQPAIGRQRVNLPRNIDLGPEAYALSSEVRESLW